MHRKILSKMLALTCAASIFVGILPNHSYAMFSPDPNNDVSCQVKKHFDALKEHIRNNHIISIKEIMDSAIKNHIFIELIDFKEKSETPLWAFQNILSLAVVEYSLETLKYLFDRIEYIKQIGYTERNEKLGLNKLTEVLKNATQITARYDCPLLIISAITNKPEIVKYLLECGAEPNEVDYRKNTALTYINTIDKATVKYLIEFGANVNAKKDNGENVLTEAVSNNRIDKEKIEILVSNGVEINEKNARGKTALDIARKKGNTDVVKYLEKEIKKSNFPSCAIM